MPGAQKPFSAAGASLRWWVVLGFLVGCFLLVYATREPPGPRALNFSGATMGTNYAVTVVVDTPFDPELLHAGIDSSLEAVVGLMSTYEKDSELSRFNASKGEEPFSLSPETHEVLRLAREIHDASDGLFDVTVGPLVNAYGFGPNGRPASVPSDAMLDALLEHTGSEKFVLGDDPPTIRKLSPGLYVDLSAIAKGFGVDQVAEWLERQGVTRYMVEVGGEVRVRGTNERDRKWRIGIEDPVSGGATLGRIVELDSGALATSGNYRNFRDIDGVRVAHTINPNTGRAVRHALLSASVYAEDCARADGWATALMVAGPEEALELARANELAVLLWIGQDDGTAKVVQHGAFPDVYPIH